MEQAIINQEFLIEKMEGKGGWTYVQLPPMPKGERNAPFNMVRVKGFIDNHEIKQFSIMPMGNGHLFLPLNAKVRKAIRKEAGSQVFIKLFFDNSEVVIPDEIKLCLMDYPEAEQVFFSFTDYERKAYMDWIYDAKQQETRINRIAKMIDKLLLGKKSHQV
jgi:hypothetical protein